VKDNVICENRHELFVWHTRGHISNQILFSSGFRSELLVACNIDIYLFKRLSKINLLSLFLKRDVHVICQSCLPCLKLSQLKPSSVTVDETKKVAMVAHRILTSLSKKK